MNPFAFIFFAFIFFVVFFAFYVGVMVDRTMSPCLDADAAYTRGEAAGIRSTTAMFEEVMRK